MDNILSARINHIIEANEIEILIKDFNGKNHNSKIRKTIQTLIEVTIVGKLIIASKLVAIILMEKSVAIIKKKNHD